MIQRKLTLTNRRGLHARAATKLVKCCQPYDAKVTLYHQGKSAQADNIMSLLMLAAPCGSVLEIHVDGPQGEEALAAVQTLFDARFDEDD
ncbi:HPr family phosphocarrier protein [Halomonas sp. PR-M31]|uniref:HPr family phosphocarrier protein n=1 Tax=Halomonas sp. PR-M31 TaxID=1471202 RepID=UPI0006501F78|nr:HPr family phosphocarrier protein [Halomonas sp. PR-M31]